MEEPKIRYYLEPIRNRNEDQNLKRLIMAEVNYRYAIIKVNGKKTYKPFRISLKKSILPRKFGKPETSYKLDLEVFSKSQSNNSTIRRAMGKLEDAIDEIYKDYDKSNGIPSPKEFKKKVEILLNRRTELIKHHPSILEFLYMRIGLDKEKLERGVQGARKENTLKTYNTLARHIENYQLATKDELRFENFKTAIYWTFLDTLDDILKGNYQIDNPNQPRKQRVQEYGFLKSSLRKIQVAFLNMFKDALKGGLVSKFNPNEDGLLVSRQESSKNLYVLESELQTLINADVSYDSALQLAKEYIIIASLTASRNETMNGLYKEKILNYQDGDKKVLYFHSKHNKNQTECFVPLLKPVMDIVESHEGKFPRFYSNAKTNKNLKDLFEEVGLERSVTETLRTYRSGKFTKEKPLFQKISSHDAKRTFTSILANYQITEAIVSSVTHPDRPSKNKMFDTYNKQTMLDKMKLFVDAINKINSDVFKF